MYLFSHRAKIDRGMQGFCAIFNPLENRNSILINRIEFDSSTTADVLLWVIKDIGAESEPNDLTSKIHTSNTEDEGDSCGVVAYGAFVRSLEDSYNLKSARILNGVKTCIVEPDDEIILSPGTGLFIRTVVYDGQVVGNISISFDKI